jgi:hypothetical protein
MAQLILNTTTCHHEREHKRMKACNNWQPWKLEEWVYLAKFKLKNIFKLSLSVPTMIHLHLLYPEISCTMNMQQL